MPTEPLHINPTDPNLKQAVQSLQPVEGICIFIDVTGSTEMKTSTISNWIAKIHNCFANCADFLNPFTPIKSIGDALMYYIECQDLKSSGYSPLQIYDGLWQIATESDSNFPEVKIGAAWCEKAYPITFIQNGLDYYGIDIDLTARLQGIADSKEVVIDFRLHQKVMQHYQAAGNARQFVSVARMVGPEKVNLKGIQNKTLVYRGL